MCPGSTSARPSPASPNGMRENGTRDPRADLLGKSEAIGIAHALIDLQAETAYAIAVFRSFWTSFASLCRQKVSGRQDSNLRPPGPQPGALPDCATPRGRQAGDRNRTGSKSLEGFCATKTLRPQGLPILQPPWGAARPPAPDPAPSPRLRLLRPAYRRSSTGTSPSSPTSPGGGQGPNQLSRAPSSVIVEPLNATPNGEASSATSQACSSGLPSR
jgi:hypothetical protein